mmetsp:Transcript_30338/g.66545  ORF Transcript_30338/g.66545 Transcript_30338/m.66545 type:complete len:84 (+) Transcript_30338:28-279(+)
MFAATRLAASGLLRKNAVRYAHAVYPKHVRDKAIQMIVEATIVGSFFAFWWRWSHMQEKQRVNDYYTKLRAEKAAEKAAENEE